MTYRRRLRRRMATRHDRGSMSVEMAGIVLPGMVLALVIVYSAFNLGMASIDVTSAAAAAARAASLQRSAPAAINAARSAAAADLSARSITCAHLSVTTDTSRWRPGGSVTVTVACAVRLRTLAGIDFIPGTVTTSARATAPLETYRSVVTR